MHFINKILNIKNIEYLIILLIFFLAHNGIKYFSSLSELNYFQSSIVFASLQNFKFLFLLFTIFVSIVYFKFVNLNWESIGENQSIKILIMITAGCLVWKFSTYDYNYYYNQFHFLDRFFLVLLFVLLWKSPIFCYALVIYLYLVINQFNFPLGGYSFTDIGPLIHLLVLFVSYCATSTLKKIDTQPFLVLGISLHVANYFIPGMAKVEISPNFFDWSMQNNLSNLFVSSYLNGWLTFINEANIISIASYSNKISPLLNVSVFLIQVLAIFCLLKKKIAISLFICFELLHVGIFLASGIFFWKWILLNLGFLILVNYLSNEEKKNLFSIKSFLISLVIIFFSPIYFKPQTLAWYDTKLNNIYKIVATDINGNFYNMSRNFFTPYDKVVTQNRFNYINNKSVITSIYGSTGSERLPYTDGEFFNTGKLKKRTFNDYKLFSILESLQNISDLDIISEDYGVNYYNIKQKKLFKNFFRQYFVNYNNNPNKKNYFKYIGAPSHIQSYYPSEYKGQKLKKIDIFYEKLYFDGDKIIIIDYKKLMSFKL